MKVTETILVSPKAKDLWKRHHVSWSPVPCRFIIIPFFFFLYFRSLRLMVGAPTALYYHFCCFSQHRSVLYFKYSITMQLTTWSQLYHLSHYGPLRPHTVAFESSIWLLWHASEQINIPLIAHCFVCVLLPGTMPARYRKSKLDNGWS